MTDLLMHFLRRIAYAYSGAILLPVALLPLAYIFTLGGHSLMILGVLGLPAGVIIGLAIGDWRMRAPGMVVLLRAVLAFAALAGCLAFLGTLRGSPFLINHGWVYIVPVGPLAAALASGLIPSRAPRPATGAHLKSSAAEQAIGPDGRAHG